MMMMFFLFRAMNKKMIVARLQAMEVHRIFASIMDEDCFVFENDDISALRAAIGFCRHSGLKAAAIITADNASSEEIAEACERGSLPIPVIVVSSLWEKTRTRLSALMDVSRWIFVPSLDSDFEEDTTIPVYNTDFSHLNVFMGCTKRPVLLLGKDVPLDQMPNVLNKRLPIAVTPDSLDLIPEYHSLFAGRVGPDGDRNGNFTVQNADLIIILGETETLQTRSDTFGREAHIVSVSNRAMFSHVYYDVPVSVFLQEWVAAPHFPHPDWLSTCRRWKSYWGNDLPAPSTDEGATMDPYYFHGVVHDVFQDTKTIVGRTGTNWWYPLYQQNHTSPGDRFLPARCRDVVPFAMGAYLSTMEDSRHWLVFLDDNRLFRIQDLSSAIEHEIPLKIFCTNHGDPLRIDDEGYLRYDPDGEYSLNDIGDMLSARVVSASDYGDLHEILQDLRDSTTELVLVDVLFGDFRPFPLGRHDLPLEVMEPHAPCAMMCEMIIAPMPGYEDT